MRIPAPPGTRAIVDWDLNNYTSPTATLDGFVWTNAHDARNNVPPYYDTDGIRSMGYYDDTSLNYYYYMATQFSTSDRWFSPVMSRTSPNRESMIAATSQGDVYPIGTDSGDQSLLTATTIFQKLQSAGITWKIYVNTYNTLVRDGPHAAMPADSELRAEFRQWGQTIPNELPQQSRYDGSHYFNDVKNGTLPQVAISRTGAEPRVSTNTVLTSINIPSISSWARNMFRRSSTP